MIISKRLAENVVQEMKSIIGKDMNFINSNGVIIASTDKSRINTYHEGGKEAIKNNDIIKIEEDGEYKGARKGLNLPLLLNGEIVGVIGISGEPKEIEKYGQIIKKMSEILIRENYMYKKEEQDIEIEKIILEKLIFEVKNGTYKNIKIEEEIKKAINKKNFILNIRINFIQENLENTIEILKNIFLEVRKSMKKTGKYCYLEGNSIIVIVDEKKKEYLLEEIDIIDKIIKKIEMKTIVSYGIGNIKNDIKNLKESYYESIKALEVGRKKRENIYFYSEMDLEIILNEITEEVKNEYLKKMFLNLSSEEILEYRKIIELYEQENGALKIISKELYMHVNTLQYKLNKFYEKTGLDIRKFKDFTKIKIAYMLL
ncbi:CdaR family transcriptional regulator [Fusobacterium mortiferum]|jgi:carbohydrate diacid regulator|uniref:CdaR family transcriptional regulator n=2 Tax=Fusobacterium mortiferum TaxID=850 RepID=UPI000E43BA81|nr:sugar diacid recognition domain-containing protein [Fusobacterium mortiferum]RGM98278.1 hypothetical protein DXB84_07180 [Fusobacterium mortiferum]